MGDSLRYLDCENLRQRKRHKQYSGAPLFRDKCYSIERENPGEWGTESVIEEDRLTTNTAHCDTGQEGKMNSSRKAAPNQTANVYWGF